MSTATASRSPITIAGEFKFGDRVELLDLDGNTIRRGTVSGSLHGVNVQWDKGYKPFGPSNPMPEGCMLVHEVSENVRTLETIFKAEGIRHEIRAGRMHVDSKAFKLEPWGDITDWPIDRVVACIYTD